MTYEACLDYLYNRLPMFSRIGAAAYKKDIHNTIALCEALGNPQQQFKSIHIAGTNGKGSTSHMLAAMLQQQGYTTGLYTSPHIKDFGERIKIDGIMIDKNFVIDFTQKTKDICQAIEPSFFELTVAMAFCYFAGKKVDIAVIETGLGGRLDSTNIITPILSIITNVGLDHMNLLGDTVEKIAVEKAGIIKAEIPVVIGESKDKTRSLFEEKAKALQAPIYWAEELYTIINAQIKCDHQYIDITDNTHQHTETFELDLTGQYQIKNLRTVIAAEKILHTLGFPIDEQHEKYALSHVRALTGLRGRWDVTGHAPTIIHDVAHNKDGITQVLQQLQSTYAQSHWHFVLGFVNDKDITDILKLLPANASYYFTNAHIARALPHERLSAIAATLGLKGKSYDDVNEAIAAAKLNAQPEDVVMVCGSFFILAEIKD